MENAGNIAAAAIDRWAWYMAAKKDPSEIGKSLKVHPNDPKQGYYRIRFKGGQWEPVAIFYPDGSNQIVGYRNGRVVRDLEALWVGCCRNPISYGAYQKAMAGDGFDDEPPAIPTIGDNSGDADPFEAIRIEMAGEVEMAGELMAEAITTQAQADKAGIWATRFTDIAKRADGEREREKAPHLAACREVDGKWKPLVDDAKEQAKALKRHVEPFLLAEKRKRDEEARKARDEAEKKRIEAMQANDEDTRAAALQAADEAERSADTKNASAGRTGARVSVRTEKIGVVTDYAAAAAALVAMNHRDIIELIDKLANRAAKASVPFAGMEIKIVEKVI